MLAVGRPHQGKEPCVSQEVRLRDLMEGLGNQNPAVWIYPGAAESHQGFRDDMHRLGFSKIGMTVGQEIHCTGARGGKEAGEKVSDLVGS